MKQDCFVIGVDYGTDSVRSIIVNAADGSEAASSVFNYPRWADGLYCDPSSQQFRQHPLDYIEGITATVNDCLSRAGASVRKSVAAISIDTTGSSPVAVGADGMPLSLDPAFASDPDAMFVLWKDHSSVPEAEEINLHAKKFGTDYLRYVGGIYSSEWFWAKLLHILRKNEQVRTACYSWVEHCDWMPFLLTGGRHVQEMKRSVCTAGHKALWSADWNGLPPESFFSSLDPLLATFSERLYNKTYTSDHPAGNLSAQWAEKLGLSTSVKVGVGAMDAHMGAVGGQIEPYHLSKVIGTSTCDMLVAPVREMEGKYVKGICGVVDGSIIPGMIGMEAGQSAFGDVYAWFRRILAWPLKNLVKDVQIDEARIAGIIDNIIPALSSRAADIPLTDTLELGVDWLNGRRTPDADPLVRGALLGMHLGTDAPAIFRALAEGTAFGARAITERFREQKIPVKGLIGLGGIARKSPFVMQMLADVMNMPIKISRADQTSALGAAMFAATVCRYYPRVEDAMQAMGQGFDKIYQPDPLRAAVYARRYEQYLAAGNFIEKSTHQKTSRQ